METEEGFYFSLTNGKKYDISFKINRKIFYLHTSVITKSLFFKTLLDNEQYMGIKDDEIIINDIYNNVLIDSSCIYEVLNYLYNDDINMMAQLSRFITGETIYDLINLLQYYTISDFFQIDDLKEILHKELVKILLRMRPHVPKEIVEVKTQSFGEYVSDGTYTYGAEILDPFDMEKENIEKIIGIFNENFSYFKKHAPNYFHKNMKKYVSIFYYPDLVRDRSYSEIYKSVLDSLLKCDMSIFRLTTTKIKNKEYYCIVDDVGIITYIGAFITCIYNIYKRVYNDIHDSLYWNFIDEEKNLPIELVEIIMSILEKDESCVILLDTKNWLKDGLLNWPAIHEFEKICNYNGQQEQFKKKIKAFLDTNYM